MKIINIFAFLFCISLNFVFGKQYISSDKAESYDLAIIVYQTNDMNVGQNIYNKTINFNQKYNQKPSILLGLNHLDIDYNTSPNISYEVSVSDISQSQAILTVQKLDSGIIYGLHIFYFVIQDNEVVVQSFKLLLSDGRQQTQQFKLPPKIQTENQVQCLLTGVNAQLSSNKQKQFGIQVTFTQSNYTIKINGNENLNYITVNCIEYYIYTGDPYSQIADVQFFNSTNQVSSTFSAKIANNYIDSQLTSFIGITFIDTILDQNIVLRARIQLSPYSNFEQPVLLQTWNQNQLETIQALFFDYQMYNCKQNELVKKVNFSDQKVCVEFCPQYSNSCSTSCPDVQFNYQSTCSATQPPNTYCDEFNQCKQCLNSTCLACSNNLNLCTSCNNQYLYNGSCYSGQQNSTFCDDNKICIACKNKACLYCNNSLNQCLQCSPQQYLYQYQCYATQPNQTGCQNQICVPCKDQNCMFCNSIDQSCSTCIANYYFYNSQCSSYQPQGTYCSFDQIKHQYNCQTCSTSGCQTCNSDKNQCSTCQNNQYMYNNNCYSSQPPGSNCKQSNDNFFICSQCKQNGCFDCKYNINQCSSCLVNQFLYNSKCYDQQPQGTKCNQIGGNQQSYNCQSCAVSGCKDCNTKIDLCSSCQSGYYLYNFQCLKKQPNSTYCSDNTNFYSCQSCLNQQCQSCDSSLLKCISCLYYLFEGNCYKYQPQNTYCDQVTRVCNQCSNQSCKTCKSNLSICQSCPNQYYLFLDSCSKQQPHNTYCDKKNNCLKCKNETCLTCDQNLQICQTCPPQTYLYGNKCYQQQPQNSFCQNKNNYLQCHIILESGCNVSCGVCYGKEKDQCAQCSSETRIFKQEMTTCECKDGYSEVYQVDCEQNLLVITILLNLSQPLTYILIGLSMLQMIGLICFIPKLNQYLSFTHYLNSVSKINTLSLFYLSDNEQKNIQNISIIAFAFLTLEGMSLTQSQFVQSSRIDNQLIGISTRKRLDSPQSPLKNPTNIQLENISTFKLKTISVYDDTYKVQFQNLPSKTYQPRFVNRQLSVFADKLG
ncbi:hypothetical protein ABPG74_015381 [Tetrahymena malaccensis]